MTSAGASNRGWFARTSAQFEAMARSAERAAEHSGEEFVHRHAEALPCVDACLRVTPEGRTPLLDADSPRRG